MCESEIFAEIEIISSCHNVSELYLLICNTVCNCTGLSEEIIFGSNKEECVDARYVLIFMLSKYLTDGEISKVTSISRACANKIRNSFKNKMKKYSIRLLVSEIESKIKI